MSDTSEALPQARSGIGFGTVLRLLAIALGIVSATLLAVNGFKVPVNQAFMEVLEGVREFVGNLVWPFERLLVTPIVNLLREQGFVFELQEHWKHAFILLWLVFASSTRADGWYPGVSVAWSWAAVCALTFGVLAGTVPLSDPRVFWWAASGYFLFWAGDAAARPIWSSIVYPHIKKRWSWFEMFGAYALPSLALAAFCGLASILLAKSPVASNVAVFWLPFAASHLYFALRAVIDGWLNWGRIVGATIFVLLVAQVVPDANLLFETSRSPGLTAFATVIAIESVTYAFWGASLHRGSGDSFAENWLGDPLTRVGLDVLAILGGATIIVYVAHMLA